MRMGTILKPTAEKRGSQTDIRPCEKAAQCRSSYKETDGRRIEGGRLRSRRASLERRRRT